MPSRPRLRRKPIPAGSESLGSIEPGDPSAPEPETDEPIDLNQIVAYNFRRAREHYGLTQDEAAMHLEPALGVRLTQTSISAIERAYDGGRRREFDAHEILSFALGFRLPLAWFFLPPPGDRRPIGDTGAYLDELYWLIFGSNEQLPILMERFRELGIREPGEDDAIAERVYGTPTPVTLSDYRHRRKEALLALLDSRADEVDKAADEMYEFFGHLNQVGIRGYISERLMDPDYSLPPEHRGGPNPIETNRRLLEQREEQLRQLREEAKRKRGE